MSLIQKWSSLCKKTLSNLKQCIEFQSRIWVIQVTDGQFKDESIIINEDNFSSPLQWMVEQDYDHADLKQVEHLKRSEILILTFGDIEHRIMRAK